MPKKNKNKGMRHVANKKSIDTERRYLSDMTRVYIVFVLSIFPLIIGFKGYDDIIYGKALPYWWITGIFLFVFLLFYAAFRFGGGGSVDGGKWYRKMNLADCALIVFFIVITISCVLSPYQDITWFGPKNRSDGWLTMFFMLACYFPISRYYNPKQIDFSLYAISSMVFCAVGYLQFYGFDFMNLFPYNRPPYVDASGVSNYSGFSIHFRSTIGNVDFVSTYVCIAVVVFFVLYAKTGGYSRFFYFAASVMNFAMMIIAGAQAGKVGVLGALILLMPYLLCERESAARAFILAGCLGLSYVIHHWHMLTNIMPLWGEGAPREDLIMRDTYATLPLQLVLFISVIAVVIGAAVMLLKRWPKLRTARILCVAATAAVIIAGILCVEIAGRSLPPQNIIYQAREMMHGNIEDSFGTNRGFVWRNALAAAKDQPLFGTGQDTFEYALGDEAQDKAHELYGVTFDKAHNDFLQILLCNGIFGLIAYAALIAGIIAYSVKPAFNDVFLLAAFAAVLAYLGQSMFGIDSITVTPIFWLFISITRNRQLAADLRI